MNHRIMCVYLYIIYIILIIYHILIYINYIRSTSIIYYRIMNYQSLRSAPAKVDRGTRPQGFTPVVQIESVPKSHLQCLCKRQLMGLPGIFPICSYKSAINPQLNKQLQYLMLRSRLGHCFCITSLATDAWFPLEAFLRRAKFSFCSLKTRSLSPIHWMMEIESCGIDCRGFL